MKKDKIRVCIWIDRKLNDKFKSKYPLMLSRYVEKCIQDGLKDDTKILDSVKKETTFNIFNIGV